MSPTEISLEQRHATYEVAEARARDVGERWLEARTRHQVVPADVESEYATACEDLRRAARRLRDTERRLARRS